MQGRESIVRFFPANYFLLNLGFSSPLNAFNNSTNRNYQYCDFLGATFFKERMIVTKFVSRILIHDVSISDDTGTTTLTHSLINQKLAGL